MGLGMDLVQCWHDLQVGEPQVEVDNLEVVQPVDVAEVEQIQALVQILDNKLGMN